MITRKQAKLIAEELYKLMRNDCKEAAAEIAERDAEEFLTVREAAKFLKWSPSTVYRRRQELGCYVKVGNTYRFPKAALAATVASGRLERRNP